MIAGLARVVGDVGLAEDLAQDALVVALERWPGDGVPDNPGAWLMATAKNRGIPVLSTEARVALTLRVVGSLTTAEIARAFLAKESTVAQRIVRAKRTLAEAKVPIEVPGAVERQERLSSVLEVIYATFNEGYAASGGEAWIRHDLCGEAIPLLDQDIVRSPVVRLNRAVAVGMAFGPEAGLGLLDDLVEEPALRGYHLLPAARGELLERLGREEEARAEFARAAELSLNSAERQHLLARAESR